MLNPVLSELSQHIDVKYQHILDHIRQGNIMLKFVRTEDMAGDMMTDNLVMGKFRHQLHLLGMS